MKGCFLYYDTAYYNTHTFRILAEHTAKIAYQEYKDFYL